MNASGTEAEMGVKTGRGFEDVVIDPLELHVRIVWLCHAQRKP